MSARTLWAVLAVALPAFAAVLADINTIDLTYHLRAGNEILSGGGIPTIDTWTYTANGMPWQDQQWGAQAILELAWRAGGWTGLVLLRMVVTGATFGAAFLAITRAGAAVRPAALVALISFAVASPTLGLRPQLIGTMLFALVLLLLGERHRHPRLVWLVPILTIGWANIHGSFFFGPLAVGAAWLDDVVAKRPDARRSLVLLIATGLATLVNPFGPWVWLYAIGLTTNAEVTERIQEWQPTSPRTVTGLAFFSSALAAAWLLIRRGSATRWPILAWLAGLLLIGAYAIRGVAWWSIGAAVALAPLLPAARRAASPPAPAGTPAPAEPRVARQLNALIAGLLILAAIILLPVFRPSDEFGPKGALRNAPPGVTTALLATLQPGDHVFNPQPWGSWFEWIAPAGLVGVDSRIELFPAAVWDDYAAVVAGTSGWQAILDRDTVRIVVTSADQGAEFPDRLRASGTWTETWSGADGSIFVRR
jgi:hypothetical protein